MKLTYVSMILLAVAALAACSSTTTETDEMQQEPGLENGSYAANLNGFNIHYEIHGNGPVVTVSYTHLRAHET